MSSMRLTNRAVIEVAGADAVPFLQGLVSQSVDKLAEGDAAFGALLTPQGKISADFFLQRTPKGFLLDAHAGVADGLLRKLSVYKLRAAVTIAPRADFAVAAGDGAPPAGLAAFVDPRLAALGWRAMAPFAALPEAVATEADYVRRRRGLGAPELGADFAPDTLFLTDVNYDALRGVDYRKGCFVGQEVTSRMKRKGELRKRSLIIRFDGAAPQQGSAVESVGVEIGEVLGAEGGVGVALIRLDRLGDAERGGAPIIAAGVPLRVELPSYLEEA